jgi:hypothetical protein
VTFPPAADLSGSPDFVAMAHVLAVDLTSESHLHEPLYQAMTGRLNAPWSSHPRAADLPDGQVYARATHATGNHLVPR